MKNIDFNFFSDDEQNKNLTNLNGGIKKYITEFARQILSQKESLLKIALIEIEGSLPSVEDLMKYGGIQRLDNGTEFLIWKQKRIIVFDVPQIINGSVVLNYKFLYE